MGFIAYLHNKNNDSEVIKEGITELKTCNRSRKRLHVFAAM